MSFVYILLSLRDHKMYIGITENLKQRIMSHNAGRVLSTKHRRPLKLIYFEGYINRGDAQRREKYFKTSPGKKAIKMMLRITLQENISPVPPA